MSFSDDDEKKKFREVNKSLPSELTTANWDSVMDKLVERMKLAISDAHFEIHAEMGSQFRERQQLEQFEKDQEKIRQIKNKKDEYKEVLPMAIP